MDYPSQSEIFQTQKKLSAMRHEYWLHHDLFAPQWWFVLATTIIPWIILWFLIDRTRIKQIWLFGSLLTILIIQLDDIGTELGLWIYHYQLFRIIPRLNPVDLSILPVFHMLVYQYFTKWKSFIWANILTAILYSYLAEPFFVKIHIYELIKWKYTFSVPIYILKAILVKYLLEKTLKLKSLKT